MKNTKKEKNKSFQYCYISTYVSGHTRKKENKIKVKYITNFNKRIKVINRDKNKPEFDDGVVQRKTYNTTRRWCEINPYFLYLNNILFTVERQNKKRKKK